MRDRRDGEILMLEYAPKYSIMMVPYRKQLALVENDRVGVRAIAYFRNGEDADGFKRWLENLLDSDANGWRRGWRDGAVLHGFMGGEE